LLPTQRRELTLRALGSSYQLSQKAIRLSDKYVLATLGILYKEFINGKHEFSYEYLHKLGPNAMKGLLVLYKEDFIKIENNGSELTNISVEFDGFNLAEKLEKALGGSLELLTQELTQKTPES